MDAMDGDRLDWIFDGDEPASLEERYDAWAATYDADHGEWGWRGPDLVASATLRHLRMTGEGVRSSTQAVAPEWSDRHYGMPAGRAR